MTCLLLPLTYSILLKLLKRLNKIYRKPSIISPGLTELFVRFNNGLIHGQEGRGVYTGV